MSTVKIVGRNDIFSPFCLIKQLITKEKAINHECVMVTRAYCCVHKISPGIITNYAYPGRLLK